MALILQGKPIADTISDQIRVMRAELDRRGVRVSVAAVQVGNDPATEVYVRNQKKQAENHGIEHRHHQLPDTATQADLLAYIQKLNRDPAVTGIIVLTPLPGPLDAWSAQVAVEPKKDIEGIHPANLGLLVYNQQRLAPCTALAAVKMIEATGVDPVGAETVIVGRSAIVGKPAALLLLEKKLSATVTICHTGTSKRGRLAGHVARADIVIAAMGVPGAIKGEWIKEGAIVIDVGVNQTEAGLAGDVEFEPAARRAGIITPVPGGVGTVTTRILMLNAVQAARWQLGE
jgi:methylenetetrahydrofolate dehydrogenase (NADP+) / methenyltetrahydrofolate cyclohydrolase